MTNILEAAICILLILFFLWKLSPSLKKDLKASIAPKEPADRSNDMEETMFILGAIVKQFADHLYREQTGSLLKDIQGIEIIAGDSISFVFEQNSFVGTVSLNLSESGNLIETEPYIINCETNEGSKSISLGKVSEIHKLSK